MDTQAAGDELLFVPLGGAGEIGMNLNLYGYGTPGRHRWLMIDLGLTFADHQLPGIDVILPDPTFVIGERERLDGLVLTHAHEDHLGAVAYLWRRLRCPVYGTPFALAMLRRKLAEAGLDGDVPLRSLAAGENLSIGPFRLELIGLAHSIPEAVGVVVRTPRGTVFHSGDWKLDPEPVVGGRSDEAALRRIGDEGVLALVCDSTNVFEEIASPSEGSLLEPLTEAIRGCVRRAVVTCFSSNIARLVTIARAAAASGRDVVMTGGSLRKNETVARQCGYLAGLPRFLEAEEGNRLPPERMLLVCTGCQGEGGAALSRLAADTHPLLSLSAGDTVIFSSRIIPGNESAVLGLQETLLRRGIGVITQRDTHVHVSGHPARPELARMYDLVRPAVVIPIHGETRHLREHARFAEDQGVPETLLVENGDLVHLAPDRVGIVGQVASGRIAVDGNRLLPVDSEVLRSRARMSRRGVALVTLVLDASAARVTDVHASTIGVVDADEEEIIDAARTAIRNAVDAMPASTYNNDAAVKETVGLVVRRLFRHMFEKRPVTQVHLLRK
jgi:ribonuclease J